MRTTASIVAIVVGIVMAVAGVVTWVVVSSTLSEQKIVVADDASCLAGDEVDGPFSAYAQAEAINDHATEAGGGKTYAELAQDDPARQTVMTADFLQASLFTSVVAFGVAALVVALGVVMIFFGFTFRELDRRTRAPVVATEPATA